MRSDHVKGLESWADMRGGRNLKMAYVDEFVANFGPPIGAKIPDIWNVSGMPDWGGIRPSFDIEGEITQPSKLESVVTCAMLVFSVIGVIRGGARYAENRSERVDG